MVNTTAIVEVSEDDGGDVSQVVIDAVPRLAKIITAGDDSCEDQTTNLPSGIGASIYGGLNTKSTQSLVASQPKDAANSPAVETVVEENSESHAPTPTADVFIENDSSAHSPTTDGGTTNREDENNTKQEKGISLQELIYAASSYHAVVKPVSITMILTALAVMYINTDATKEAGEQALAQTYQRYTISDDQSAATSLGLGLVNALKGIPRVVNQAYLVLTSVIVAWQLSYFNDWMAWTLLVMLALYDLCAVLTPCGPLKALVKLMSKDDAPDMPGLLYEARLPSNATRPGRNRSGASQRQSTENSNGDVDEQPMAIRGGGEQSTANPNDNSTTATTTTQQVSQTVQSTGNGATQQHRSASHTITLPFAVAKVYKLPIISFHSLGTTVDTSSPTAYLRQDQQFSSTELQTNVEVKLPKNGGRIETVHNKKGEPRYVVYNKEGEVKRTLLVAENGKVMEIVPGGDDDKNPENNNIKLGLGDFIFYSVLVAKASENGFAAFASCYVSILAGLGGTLVLLSVYHQALPALPISIFVAVIMFVVTIYCMEPWIQDMWTMGPYYV